MLLGACVAAGIALNLTYKLPWPGLDDTAARAIGLAIGAAGIALIVWAAMTLWRHRTTVLPNRGVSALVTDGPYRFRRNPIYIGDAMVLLGLAEMTKNIWFAILVPVFVLLVTWLAIIPEERHLEARYGDEWRAYRDRTRRWL
ncbi:MAG: isoprenylcysteine carboxylmethyltransferase family protein [Hyphomicrobiaceae bacterium]|nr:isoprenylcysteine carboxylmethyltransferase family protein [Hyphomicrobiaceae bacterium]